ncbi:unnamed protein product [Polarella glacialis]|uniref:Uncharacterized protein n=1 Tax=Polarella glacialis TaxID=89957 RepID=A0A813D8Y0_POLGL|nr:unnamed protein product [Polarella glacialis]
MTLPFEISALAWLATARTATSLNRGESWWSRDLPMHETANLGAGLFPEALLQCWGPSTGNDWAECCSPDFGPQGDEQCWRQAPGLSFEICCLHHSMRTFEGEMRIASSRLFDTAGLCPPSLASVCELADNRTSRARRTRRIVRRRLVTPAPLRKPGGSIPVLGIPVAFDYDFLTLRLLQSIDFPVDLLLLILSGSGSSPHLERLAGKALQLRPDLILIRSPVNLGAAGGFNEVVHANPSAPWWLICSHDVAFPSGMLARAASATWQALQKERDSRDGGERPTTAPGLRYFRNRGQPIHALTAFALTARAVASAGLFDENLWPANAEDIDYMLRMRIFEQAAGVAMRDADIEVIHGPETCVAQDQQSMRFCSGIWNAMNGAQRAASESESESLTAQDENANDEEFVERAAREEVRLQLTSALNFDVHVMQKYGPLNRTDGRPEYAEGSSGPFGMASYGWDEWVLDPSRRACVMQAGPACGIDIRFVEQDAYARMNRFPAWSAWLHSGRPEQELQSIQDRWAGWDHVISTHQRSKLAKVAPPQRHDADDAEKGDWKEAGSKEEQFDDSRAHDRNEAADTGKFDTLLSGGLSPVRVEAFVGTFEARQADGDFGVTGPLIEQLVLSVLATQRDSAAPAEVFLREVILEGCPGFEPDRLVDRLREQACVYKKLTLSKLDTWVEATERFAGRAFVGTDLDVAWFPGWLGPVQRCLADARLCCTREFPNSELCNGGIQPMRADGWTRRFWKDVQLEVENLPAGRGFGDQEAMNMALLKKPTSKQMLGPGFLDSQQFRLFHFGERALHFRRQMLSAYHAISPLEPRAPANSSLAVCRNSTGRSCGREVFKLAMLIRAQKRFYGHGFLKLMDETRQSTCVRREGHYCVYRLCRMHPEKEPANAASLSKALRYGCPSLNTSLYRALAWERTEASHVWQFLGQKDDKPEDLFMRV